MVRVRLWARVWVVHLGSPWTGGQCFVHGLPQWTTQTGLEKSASPTPGASKSFRLATEKSTFLAQWASKPLQNPVLELTGKICIEMFRKDVSYAITCNYM